MKGGKSMACKTFEENIDAFIDGELKEEKEAFEKHLSTCDACRRLYEETLEIKALLSNLEPLDLPEDFEVSLHEKLIESKAIPFYQKPMVKKIGFLSSVAAIGVIAFMSGLMVDKNMDQDKADDLALREDGTSMEITLKSYNAQMDTESDDATMYFSFNEASDEENNEAYDEAYGEAYDEPIDATVDEENDEQMIASITMEEGTVPITNARISQEFLTTSLAIYHYQLVESYDSNWLDQLIANYDVKDLNKDNPDLISFDLSLDVLEDFITALKDSGQVLQELKINVEAIENESLITIIIER